MEDYTRCVNHYLDLILANQLPLRATLGNSNLPIVCNIEHSKYRKAAYKQASEIIRSQSSKANQRRYKRYQKVYAYLIKHKPNHPFLQKRFKKLNLKPVHLSKYFTKPNLNNVNLSLESALCNIRRGNHFDNFVKITTPYRNYNTKNRYYTIHLPLKQHRHSNQLLNSQYQLKNTIQVQRKSGKTFINLFWEKNAPQPMANPDCSHIGIDLGQKVFIQTSDNQSIGQEFDSLYEQITRKQRGSKAYKRKLIQRDNLINYCINQKLDLNGVELLSIEDLKQVKHKSKLGKKTNNKLQYWSYAKTIKKLEQVCSETGIKLMKVSPAYTSQTCSNCGSLHRENRSSQERFRCIDCGYSTNADYNAALNIDRKGCYRTFRHEKQQK
jgi:IS605 OrfB family transposase